MNLKKLSLKGKLVLLSVLFVTGTAALGTLAFTTISEIKIGGWLYNRIRVGVNVASDYAPAAGNLMPARVRIFEMSLEGKDPALLQKDIDQFEAELKAFESIHDRYETMLPAGDLKDLMEKAYARAHDYIDLARGRFIPLLRADKFDEAEKLRRSELKLRYYAQIDANQQFTVAISKQLAATETLAEATVASRTLTLLIVALVAIASVVIVSFIIAKGILTPINETVEVLHDISKGDLSHHIAVVGTDEIAQMAIALNDTVDNLSRSISRLGADAEVLIKASSAADKVSKELTANSNQTTSQASAVSSAAEQVSQNVQTVSTAAEEMSSSIKEISKSASEAAEVASSAARLASSTTATMTKLSESSAQIGNVIKVITSIAGQTNLLALNATIEAARAGEAGKGFAVVANEVKELAKETAKATEDIGAKIVAIQQDAKGAVQAIDEITGVIGRINDIQNTIASAVEEQTGTTNEISRNVSESARGSSDIASNIVGVASSAKATQNCAATVETSATEMMKVAQSLTEVVGQFRLASNDHVVGLASASHQSS